jgi:hypothetical protein
MPRLDSLDLVTVLLLIACVGSAVHLWRMLS